MMNNPLRFLCLEDSPLDVELVRHELKKLGEPFDLRVACNRAEYDTALNQTQFDLILSDYNLPGYDGLTALWLARQKQPEVPFILISGALSEEQVMEYARLGATDCLVKGRLDRLIPVVTRALKEADERRARQKAEKVSQRRAALLDQSYDAIFAFELDGPIIYWNQGATRLYGFAAEEAAGRVSYELLETVFPDSCAQCKDALLRAGWWEGELNHRTADGRRITVESRMTLVREGGTALVLEVNRDITERKQAEAAAEERARGGALVAEIGAVLTHVNAMPEMLRHCAEAIVRHLNAAFARIWTLNKRENVLQLQASAGLYTHLDGAHSRVPVGKFKIGQIAQERKPHLTNQVVGDPRISDQAWAKREGMVAFTGYPLIVDDRLIGVMAMFARHPLADTTLQALGAVADGIAVGIERRLDEEEIRKLNAELEQRVRERTAELQAANKELEAFSYSVSHDLRAPLRAIIGYANIIKEDCAKGLSEEGRINLEVICAEAARMSQLIDDLLEFSRSGRQAMQMGEVDMGTLAQAAFAECAALEPTRRIEFHLHPLPPVRGDLALLRQVWANLISNAVKYSRPMDMATIEIGSRAENGEVVFYVKDNGAGFDMNYANQLFGVFKRLHAADEFEGTGVGLALVARIVHRHGGRVWAEGKVNEGATFFFSLPGIVAASS